MRLFILAGLLISVPISAAAEDDKDSAVRPLPLRSSPAPVPALRYRLLPARHELLPGNAAVVYPRAIALAREHERPTPREYSERLERLLGYSDSKPAPDDIRAFLAEREGVFQELDRAARRARCEWELEDDLSFDRLDALFAQIQNYREMTRLLSLRTQFAIDEGRFEDACHSLQTGFALARHVGTGPTMIHTLVGIALASIQLGEVERMMRRPDSPNLYWALSALPRPLVGIREAIRGEMRLIKSLFPDLDRLGSQRLSRIEADRLLQSYVQTWWEMVIRTQTEQTDPPTLESLVKKYHSPARESLKKLGFKPDLIAVMPDSQAILLNVGLSMRQRVESAFKYLYLPLEKAQAILRHANADDVSEAETLGGLVPSMGSHVYLKVLVASVRVERLLDALRAAEAIRMHIADNEKVPTSWADLHEVPIPNDPGTGQPFGYEANAEWVRIIAPPPKGEEANLNNSLIIQLNREKK